MRTAIEYLRSALKELHASRAELDRQIDVIERTLSDLEDDDTSKGATKTIRDIILDLAHTRSVVTAQEVLEAASEQGIETKYTSVSSILSRLSREGVMQKGARRGTYELSSSEDDDARATANSDNASIGNQRSEDLASEPFVEATG